MNNPYEVLNVNQNATKEEIHKALFEALKENAKTKRFSPKEVMEAEEQLLKLEKRLVADFLYPSKFKSKRLKVIDISNLEISESVDVNSIDEDAFDSLRFCQNYE